jgi:hypothetical protein
LLLAVVGVHSHEEILPLILIEYGGSHLLGLQQLDYVRTLMDPQIQLDWKVQSLEILDYINRLLLDILLFIFMPMYL